MCRVFLTLLVLSCWLTASPSRGADDEKPQRLSLEKARTRIVANLLAANPKLILGDQFTVMELTTDAVWKRLGVQVFKTRGGPMGSPTFVLRGNDVFAIGRDFGGDGVGSLCVADLAGDKKPLLVYAFAWGSGVHRSQVAVFDVLAKQPKEVVASPSNYSFDDFRVQSVDEKTVEVVAGKHTVGRLMVEKKEDQMKASIRLEEKLPEEIRKKFR